MSSCFIGVQRLRIVCVGMFISMCVGIVCVCVYTYTCVNMS